MTQQGASRRNVPNGGIVIRRRRPSRIAFLDSVLQILSQNIGAYVICEFLVHQHHRGQAGHPGVCGRTISFCMTTPARPISFCDATALRFVSICFGDEEGQQRGYPGGGGPAGPSDSAAPAPAPTPAPRTLTGTQMVAPTKGYSQAAFNYAKEKPGADPKAGPRSPPSTSPAPQPDRKICSGFFLPYGRGCGMLDMVH